MNYKICDHEIFLKNFRFKQETRWLIKGLKKD